MKTHILSAIAVISALTASGAVKLPPLLGDGMVVQRGEEVSLWGKADPGEKITARSSNSKKTYTTEADEKGRWQLKLKALPAGGPYTITVNDVTIGDVLSGDVLLCSGQSNMELPVRRVMDMFADEVNAYENANIRQFYVPQVTSFHGELEETAPSSWKSCTQSNVQDFSALAYFMAKQLNEDTGVPVGIINSSWGGTPVEAWTSEHTMEQWPEKVAQKKLYEDDGYRDRLKKLEGENYYRWNTLLDNSDPGLSDPVKWYAAGLDDSDWEEVDLVNDRWGIDNENNRTAPVNGSHWLRKHVRLSGSQASGDAVLRMGCIEGADSAYVNGVFVGTVGYQYPPRIYKVPSTVLKEGDNVVTVRVISGSGEPKVVPEKPYKLKTADGSDLSLEGRWKYRTGTRMPQGPSMIFWHYTPVVLYDAMVAPLFNYPVKGVVWYQGESNVGNRELYYDMLKAMMSDWRAGFGREEMPFYIVELADFLHPSDTGGRKAWAEMRREQARVADSDQNAWLIKNSDLGEWNDIHPLDKKTLGIRVAKEILKGKN